MVVCLTSFGRLVQKLFPDAPYPKLGILVLDATKRVFSEETITKGKAAVSILNLGSGAHGKQASADVMDGKKALHGILDDGATGGGGAGAGAASK